MAAPEHRSCRRVQRVQRVLVGRGDHDIMHGPLHLHAAEEQRLRGDLAVERRRPVLRQPGCIRVFDLRLVGGGAAATGIMLDRRPVARTGRHRRGDGESHRDHLWRALSARCRDRHMGGVGPGAEAGDRGAEREVLRRRAARGRDRQPRGIARRREAESADAGVHDRQVRGRWTRSPGCRGQVDRSRRDRQHGPGRRDARVGRDRRVRPVRAGRPRRRERRQVRLAAVLRERAAGGVTEHDGPGPDGESSVTQ